MKNAYFLILSIVYFTSCQTILKDKQEIEKIIEDATDEIIEDLNHAP